MRIHDILPIMKVRVLVYCQTELLIVLSLRYELYIQLMKLAFKNIIIVLNTERFLVPQEGAKTEIFVPINHMAQLLIELNSH